VPAEQPLPQQPPASPQDSGTAAEADAVAHAWLARYLDHLAAERRLAALSVRAYRGDIERLLRYADGHALGTLVVQDIRRFAGRAHGEGLSGRSIARMLAAWRSFFHWLIRERQLAGNPALGVKAPRSGRRLPKVLSPDEAAQLLDPVSAVTLSPAAAAEQTPARQAVGARDQAMLELLYSSGLRCGELVGLDLGDVRMVDALVRVTGKGSRTREVPVGRQALAAIALWLTLRPQLAQADCSALFVGMRGQRIAPRTVFEQVRQWAKRRGLTQALHPHMLRHSFASHVLQSSGDLRAVQEMLGHASIATTQIYTHLDFQALAKAYDAAHPRARRTRGAGDASGR
jgi:integrase/recombinase XerC